MKDSQFFNWLNFKEAKDLNHNDSSSRLLTDFITKVAIRTRPISILDPSCGSGFLLQSLARETNAKIIHGVELNHEKSEKAISNLGIRAKIIAGNFLKCSEKLNFNYDLIVADCSRGFKMLSDKEQATLLLHGSVERHSDNEIIHQGETLALWTAERISHNGRALITLNSDFFSRKRSKAFWQKISKLGCRIGAAIHIPPESNFRSAVERDSYLAVIETGVQEDLFIGQLSDDSDQQKRLASNLLNRKEKGTPDSGRLCPINEFRSFDTYMAKQNVSRHARKLGWKSLPAQKVFSYCKTIGSKFGDTHSDDDVSIYLRESWGNVIRAYNSWSGPEKHTKDMLHLRVDPLLADADFMVYWFNETTIGKLTLDSLGKATEISGDDLLLSTIHLPSMEEQSLTLKGLSLLRKITSEVNELRDPFRRRSEPITDWLDQIEKVNKEDRYEDWIETLPFPLASILWRHHASKESYKHRYEILLQFFEGATAFLATIHLSAFMQIDHVWAKHGRDLKQQLTDQGLSIKRATFGSWKLVFEFLSNVCEKLISDNEKKEDEFGVEVLYRTKDTAITKMLSDKNLRRIFQRANKIRNTWHGHGGAVSNTQAKLVHDELDDLVQQIRSVFQRLWGRFELIQPGKSIYKGGVHHVTCKRLMGTRSNPFEEVVIESLQPLDAERLFLFDDVNRSGLQLRPFVEVMPSPDKQAMACFIYNRKDKDITKWVSYHFEEESQISYSSQGIEETLSMFDQFD